jgi:cell division protease FtsH
VTATKEQRMPVTEREASSILDARTVDVGASRETSRRRRLRWIAVLVGIPAAFLWFRILVGSPVDLFRMPTIDPLLLFPLLMMVSIIFASTYMIFGGAKSPHVMYRPEQIDVTIDDVKGVDVVREEVIRSLNLFLAHKEFTAQTGGAPRRGLLFEGAPGTGKTHLAKAMAREAGVPFLYVSATSFQSQMYGATARRIRSYFRALRKAARQEGGAIGFIEEIDAIGSSRGGLSATPMPDAVRMAGMPMGCGGLTGLPSEYAGTGSAALGASVQHPSMIAEGVGGVVNELLVQMQSFDEPTGMQKVRTRFTDKVNLLLPAHRQLSRPVPPRTNLLLIAATNRADNLDPALLRPGRFDRRLTFESPTKAGRRALIDLFLDRRNRAPELDEDEQRDAIAAETQEYTPVMIEHLFDEALVNAMRRGERAMNRTDVEHARLVEEIGLGQPVGYTDHEKRLIATHEAGHATIAWLVAPTRRLEVLTIVKRRQALGLLAHGDREDVFTRSRTEMLGLIQIAFGGQVAEHLFFNDVSTGPGGDLLYATNIAAQMVGACGMTDTLISYGAVQQSSLTDTNLVGRVLGDPEGRARVEDILQQQKTRAHSLLEANRHLVEALRDALLERHELVGRDITDVLEAARRRGPAPLSIDLRQRDPEPAG